MNVQEDTTIIVLKDFSEQGYIVTEKATMTPKLVKNVRMEEVIIIVILVVL